MLYARLITMRLLKAVIVLFLIVIFNFFLIHMAPGDPAAVMAGLPMRNFCASYASSSGWINLFTSSYGATYLALPP